MADKENMVTLNIDGQEVSVSRGTTVLEAAKSMGINIPTFCWHPKLKPVGACRICYVEVEKRPKLEVSCATECMPDMVVHTQSEKVLQGRKAVLEFTLLNHPLDCPTCDKGGECDLQDTVFEHGIDESRFDFKKYRHISDKKQTFDDLRLGPEIIRNQNRCILCYRCVRSNKEIFGEYDIGAYYRGNLMQIMAAPGQEVDSIYSGNLVEICPVGALTNTDFRYKIRTWKTKQVSSICQYCSDGCNLTLWTGREKIVRTTSRRNDDIDEGWICNVGRYGYQIANGENRLTTPLIKKGDSQVPVSWEEAVELIAHKFTEIKDKKGGVCIGGLVAPSLDCDSLYAFSKFFRTVLGSNNVDFRTDYNMLPEKHGDLYSTMTSMKFSIADIEKSDLIIVAGSNLIKDHPVVNLRVRKAVTKLGAKLYTLNPFMTKSGDISTDELVHKPGSLDVLINGICASIIDQNLASSKVDSSKLKSMMEPNRVEDSAAITEISADRIKDLAKAIGSAKNITFITGELFTCSLARETLTAAVANLALLVDIQNRGQIGLLSKSSNSKGAEKLGVTPFLSKNTSEKLKDVWGSFPESAGLAADRMILSATKEELDSLFIVGSNPIITYPDGRFIKDGLEKLNFLVASDLYETETTAAADVVLPLSGWAEYSGQIVNLEGRVQSFDQAIKPVGHSQTLFDIIKKISAKMKVDLFETVSDLQKEYKSLLDSDESENIKLEFNEVKHIPEEINPEYPTPLYVVDELHHFGHLTEKSKSLSAFCSEGFIEMSPSMAEKYHAENGTQIRIESEVGKIVLPVKISEIIENDVVLTTRNFSATPVNIFQMRKRRIDRVKLTRVEEK